MNQHRLIDRRGETHVQNQRLSDVSCSDSCLSVTCAIVIRTATMLFLQGTIFIEANTPPDCLSHTSKHCTLLAELADGTSTEDGYNGSEYPFTACAGIQH
jgi:hypothetical protein